MVNKLNNWRKKIDKIDKKLFKLLEKRFNVSKEIGIYKKQKNLPIENKNREQSIVKSKINQTKLSKNFVKDFFQLIFKESKKIQRKLK